MYNLILEGYLGLSATHEISGKKKNLHRPGANTMERGFTMDQSFKTAHFLTC